MELEQLRRLNLLLEELVELEVLEEFGDNVSVQALKAMAMKGQIDPHNGTAPPPSPSATPVVKITKKEKDEPLLSPDEQANASQGGSGDMAAPPPPP